MKLFLKYKHLIVSFGLLPIIITLIGLHFFPNTLMLGIGLTISVAGLCYDILRLKSLNFFLLQGTIGIGACFLLRALAGYEYIPPRSITPTLEFLLLVCAFLHVTAPEIYRGFLKRFRLSTRLSYLLEAKVIVILSSIHLLGLFLFQKQLDTVSNPIHFVFVYCVPLIIYATCLILNIAGVRIAVSHDRPLCLIRIAPVCNGKIFLYPHRIAAEPVWDVPMVYKIEEILEKSERYAARQAKVFLKEAGYTAQKFTFPRLILKYHIRQLTPYPIQLFVLPIHDEDDFHLPEGRFFSFHEIGQSALRFSKILMAEKEHLQISATVWKEFTCK